jgi:DNA-binding response OmpR family regulator
VPLQALGAIREIDPEVRAILTSGYDAQGAAESLDGDSFGDVLQKPYRSDTLLARLQSLLRETGARS